MRCVAKFCRASVLVVICWARSSQAEQFLHLPTSREFSVTCKWTCPNGRGGTYYHNATDYGTPTNNEVRAAAGGEVIYLKNGLAPGQLVSDYQYGNWVKIRHSNGYETRYAHLLPNTITVRVGDRVEAGQLLGKSDNTGKSTGPHLHFEVRDPQGRRVNPYGDPPDYSGGCGLNALWVTCPPTPAPPPDRDGDGYTTARGDCNDTNRDVYPGATESCNSVDDDCDGVTDEPWRSGLAQDLGNLCIVGRGACTRTGQWVCTRDGRATACGADPGQPSPERCNNIDDDCDGQTDEDWRIGLATDIGQPCSVELLGCGYRDGTWACAPDGRAVVCTPRERCNDIDDDCNGVTDDVDSALLEDDPRSCGSCDRRCFTVEESCVRGLCVDYPCEYDRCLNFCNSQHCIGCGAGGCDLRNVYACRSNCPVNLPANEGILNCLCHGGCMAYIGGCW